MARVFLIGAGAISRHHAAAAYDRSVIDEPVEVHVTDTNAETLRAFVEQFPDAIVHDDITALLSGRREPDDIAVVATPPFTHFDLASAAIAAGFHVLCEKPLVLTAGDAALLAAQANAAGRALEGCDSRFRSLATTQRVRSLLRDGALGEIYHAEFVNRSQRGRSGFEFQSESSWFRDPSLSGGGVMMDWGPYDVAVLDEVFEPVAVEIRDAWAGRPHTGGPFEADSDRAEQHIGATFRLTLADRSIVDVSYERAAATHGSEHSSVEITGAAGAVSWDWLDWEGDEVRVSSDRGGAVVTQTEHHPTTGPVFHARPLAEFHAVLRAGEDPRTRTARTLFSFQWLRAVVESATTGQPVLVEYPAVPRPVRFETATAGAL
ncbi:Gfo/Idh/MocA family oxidoreductase [Leifsonia sp. fls2-241-R2A-40a]|uniref:Gfo/Idh/MocA family protein n=1 Tax=Leifsonia sp. fls2-241-R2A-40a TaxID=3040290 RepID=UPI00254BAE7D|nr:Gfo/Idh/MocA family oxidoreductase [Leifsonia sp. fls2-241-R2A-40a]